MLTPDTRVDVLTFIKKYTGHRYMYNVAVLILTIKSRTWLFKSLARVGKSGTYRGNRPAPLLLLFFFFLLFITHHCVISHMLTVLITFCIVHVCIYTCAANVANIKIDNIARYGAILRCGAALQLLIIVSLALRQCWCHSWGRMSQNTSPCPRILCTTTTVHGLRTLAGTPSRTLLTGPGLKSLQRFLNK